MKAILLASAAVLSLTAAAHAGYISDGSVLNIVGNANFDSTKVTFVNPADLKLGSGDFALLGTCLDCATMTSPLVYSPFVPGGTAYTASNLGYTTSFTLGALTGQTGTSKALILEFDGTATLTGFTPTPGTWVLTVNQSTGAVVGSFSATTDTTAPVPEPISLALFGVGLLGLGIVRRNAI